MGREKESYEYRENVRVKGRKWERWRWKDIWECKREREIVLESERLRARVCVRVKERESEKWEKEVEDHKKNLCRENIEEFDGSGSFTYRETPKNVKKQRA